MRNVFVIAIMTLMVIMCFSTAMAEEDGSAGVSVWVDDGGPDVWGDAMDETEESRWYGGTGRGEPEADAIEAAGGDGTGEYD
ncbi:hypothetical protein ACFL5E_02510 [Candidatus Omnitrophota bacterium]